MYAIRSYYARRGEVTVRIAAIDIGTNSIHMVIARAVNHTEFAVLDREREVVQIGHGSFGRGRLRRDAIRRTAEALRRFVQLARRHQVGQLVDSYSSLADILIAGKKTRITSYNVCYTKLLRLRSSLPFG